jgi:hypothetical protein
MTDIGHLLGDATFTFEPQPEPVPAAMRADRRVVLLLLLVAKSHGAGASWKGLQVLSWAVRTPENTELLVGFTRGDRSPDRPVVRIEPALDRAIDLAVGLELLEQKTSRVFRLTPAGRAAAEVAESSGAFVVERKLLAKFKGKVTQREITRLLEWREG